MATTQTVLETPFESISPRDETRDRDIHEQRDTIPARRVFEADPAFTTSPAARRTITALLVCANTVQVSHRFICYEPHSQYTET